MIVYHAREACSMASLNIFPERSVLSVCIIQKAPL